MANGIYPALSGAKSALKQIDVIANNLANANTKGYKSIRLLFESTMSDEISKSEAMAAGQVYGNADAVWVDSSSGVLEKTGNVLDLCVQGRGFFMVEHKNETHLTRNGGFSRDDQGFLVTAEGDRVLSEGHAPISIPQGEIVIDSQGGVFLDGKRKAQLGLVQVNDVNSLTRVGHNLLKPLSEDELFADDTSQVMQGFLESSNVDPVSEMVQLIEAHRYFDLAMQTITTQKTMNEQRIRTSSAE